ncbi:MAG: DUF3040 domain-containing protein [Nitriliruptor sp.]|uniref:DUF3040 domain-containing protein n=1 Tax=Nitriliruptor sp. TaxID=2448056 RepID=UPI0034A07589
MPLSEHEERILAEIERQLAEDDPRFVARSRRTPASPLVWPRQRRLRAAIGLGIVGVLLVLSLAFTSIGVAAIGMVCILTAIVLGATAVREQLAPTPSRAVSPDDAP